jgi:hypothetical protein
MDNVQNYDSYINIPSSQTYVFCEVRPNPQSWVLNEKQDDGYCPEL